jgi:hypothetical protein
MVFMMKEIEKELLECLINLIRQHLNKVQVLLKDQINLKKDDEYIK